MNEDSGCDGKFRQCLRGSDTGKQHHIQGTLEILYNIERAKDKMLGADPY